MQQNSVAKKIVEDLLNIGAIKLQPAEPFKWSSGWLSPIYCDNRLALSYPKVRTYIKNELANVIKNEFPSVEAIAGVATAGIPQGALVADLLNLPFIYVRPTPKTHGMENLIEGKITKNQKVVLVEDLISTGGSSIKATNALKNAGFEIEGMVAIFTYSFEIANENFNKENIKLVTLSDYLTLVAVCQEKNIYSNTHINSLNEWRKSPETWKS